MSEPDVALSIIVAAASASTHALHDRQDVRSSPALLEVLIGASAVCRPSTVLYREDGTEYLGEEQKARRNLENDHHGRARFSVLGRDRGNAVIVMWVSFTCGPFSPRELPSRTVRFAFRCYDSRD